MNTKARLDKLVTETGTVAILDVDGQDQLRVVIEDAGASNIIDISAKLTGQKDFTHLKQLVGSVNEKVNISTYEEVKIECSAIDALDVAIRIIASSFKEASGSAIEIDVPAGDSLSDIEVLTLTSSDNSVVITGDNATKSIDFKVNLNLDDVKEYPSLIDFPPVGESSTLYVALDTEKIYRWSGSTYIEVSPSPVTSVNSQTGDVVLDKSSIGLGNVNNTSDINKPISTATQTALNLKQDSLGFTPENIANKSDDSALGTSSSLYPTQKAVKEYVDSAVTAGAPDADATTKGILKLTGDLGGTADSPTVPGLATKYDASNPAGYVNSSGAAAAAPVQSVSGKVGAVSLDKSDVGLGNVDNTSDASKVTSGPIATALNAKQDALGFTPENIANKNTSIVLGTSDTAYPTQNAVKTYVDTGLSGKYDSTNPAGYITLAQVPVAPVTSVNTKTGDVVLDKSDVGLSNVDNTSDASKVTSGPIATALSGKQDALGFTPENVTNKSTNISLGTSDTAYPTQNAVKTYVDTGLSSKQNSLGFTPENIANKSTETTLGTSNDLYPTQNAVKVYVDNAITAGAPDASTSTKGILKLAGDLAGTAELPSVPALANKQATLVSGNNIKTINGQSILGSGDLSISGGVSSVNTKTGDVVLDKSDIGLSNVDNTSDASKVTSGPIATALSTKQDSLGFTPENIANKSTNVTLGTSDTLYPTQNAVKSYVDTGLSGKQNVLGFTPEDVTNKSTNISLGTSDTAYPTQNAVKSYVDTGLSSKYDASNPAGYITLAQVPPDAVTSVNGLTGAVVISTGNPISVSDEGTQITASATSINFTGGGVTASSDLSGNVTVSVSTAGDATTLIVEAYNDTGATIPKMSVVYINGAHGNLPKLSLSLGNAESTSSKTLGIVRSDISNMNNGFVVAAGKLIDLDTDIVGWNEGDSLWLSPSVAGGITNVKPLAPNHAVFVGTLIRKHPTQGIIEVKIQNGFELQELHNVSINGISDGQIIRYENATSLWKNVSLNSDGVSEGSTNLYFTDARARTAAVADSIVDGVVNIAPSQNAVFDGLSAKQATLVSGTNIKTINGSSILGSGDLVISGSGAVNSVNGQVGDVVLDKSDVGLGNVDNTSDSAKPVSTATQAALNLKADSSALSGKVSTTGDSMTGALSISVASDTALTANTLKLGNLFGGFASVTTSTTSSDSLLLSSAFPAANTASSAVYILSGYTDNANTGALLISSGNVGSGNGSSGNVQIGTGTPSGDGSSGNMDFYSANCSGTGSTGYAALRSGIKNGTTGNSGPAVVDSGANNGSGESGFVRLKSGNTVSGNSGQADIATGNVSGAGNSGNIVFTTGTVTGGVRGEIRISAPNLNLQNNSITNTAAFYFGDPNTDGTWRIIPSGSNLVTERRESGVWVTKQTITP